MPFTAPCREHQGSHINTQLPVQGMTVEGKCRQDSGLPRENRAEVCRQQSPQAPLHPSPPSSPSPSMAPSLLRGSEDPSLRKARGSLLLSWPCCSGPSQADSPSPPKSHLQGLPLRGHSDHPVPSVLLTLSCTFPSGNLTLLCLLCGWAFHPADHCISSTRQSRRH